MKSAIIVFLPTAPAANGNPLQIVGPLAAQAAYGFAAGLKPVPWSSDWKQATALLATLGEKQIAYGFWLNSGLGNKYSADFYRALKNSSTVMELRVRSDAENAIYALKPPKGEGEEKRTCRHAR